MAIMCLLSHIKRVPVVRKMPIKQACAQTEHAKAIFIRLGSARKHLRRILEAAKEVFVHSVFLLVLLLPSYWLT